MKLLLDENVPQPLASTIRTLLQAKHEVVHVIELPGWGGTKDISLYGQAADAGFGVILTNDAKQMKRKPEVEAIAKSGIHRVQYPHRHGGLVGVGLAMATVCAALPSVLAELESAPRQQLVALKGIDPSREHRYLMRDPATDPPKFWPDAHDEELAI